MNRNINQVTAHKGTKRRFAGIFAMGIVALGAVVVNTVNARPALATDCLGAVSNAQVFTAAPPPDTGAPQRTGGSGTR